MWGKIDYTQVGRWMQSCEYPWRIVEINRELSWLCTSGEKWRLDWIKKKIKIKMKTNVEFEFNNLVHGVRGVWNFKCIPWDIDILSCNSGELSETLSSSHVFFFFFFFEML